MVDLVPLFIIVTLVIVIIIQAIERFVYADQMQRQQKELMMAFLSKNAMEFSVAVKTEKEPNEEIAESDEVELDKADDKEFDKHIAEQGK